MRNTFINNLCKLAKSDSSIFLLCADLGYSVLESFASQFPDRFINVGIAEQNMMGVAVGLSREGYNVFAYSIGNFPTLRCMEQIRYDICYHRANVKIVAVGAGYAYGSQGVSHHTTEDLSMLRSIPNMLICCPGDPVEAKAAAEFMVKYDGPGYVRLNKSGEPAMHSSDIQFNHGSDNIYPVLEGEKTVVLSTGAILSQAVTEVRNAKVNWSVYSVPIIGNYSLEWLTKLMNQYDNIITIEEHQLNGGFGSSLIEAYSDLYALGAISKMPRIKRIGIPNTFIGFSGDQDYLRKHAGITLIKNIV